MESRRASTLIGLLAVVLWSLGVGLIRVVSEYFGPLGGMALMYTAALVFLLFTVGPTRIRVLPRRYLFWGGVLFVGTELCFSLSIGYASNGRQAIEVSMLNYLWPTFTIAAAIMFTGQKSSPLIIPGFVLSMMGICWVLGGEHGLDPAGMLKNIASNPLSYGMAFMASVLWAAYCTVTARLAQGKNAVTFFFALVAALLWAKFLGTGGHLPVFTVPAVGYLLAAAAAIGFGYAAWNVGILRGNVTVLAGASYFIPVFSSAFASFLLSAPLTATFWQGAAMVCLGSTLCWIATREKAVPQEMTDAG